MCYALVLVSLISGSLLVGQRLGTGLHVPDHAGDASASTKIDGGEGWGGTRAVRLGTAGRKRQVRRGVSRPTRRRRAGQVERAAGLPPRPPTR